MVTAPDALVDALMCHAWTSTEETVFRRNAHINLLEMEMLKREVQARVNSGRGFCRMVNLCDSRVVVGAYAKGRSSSKQLNHCLKNVAPGPLQVICQSLICGWIPSATLPITLLEVSPFLYQNLSTNIPFWQNSISRMSNFDAAQQSKKCWNKRCKNPQQMQSAASVFQLALRGWLRCRKPLRIVILQQSPRNAHSEKSLPEKHVCPQHSERC